MRLYWEIYADIVCLLKSEEPNKQWPEMIEKIIMRNFLILIMCLVFSGLESALAAVPQSSSTRPFIWITQGERADLLNKIANEAWAADYLAELKSRVDSDVNQHVNNPGLTINQIPAFGADPNQSSESTAANHKKILSPAADAALLYFITQQEKYAQYAADILEAYFDHLAPLTPETTTICGSDFYDPRTTYNHIAIAYDFIYNFLRDPSTTVYDNPSGTRIPFDNAKAQQALSNIVGDALQEWRADRYGRTVSNHPILTAPGALFPILCIEDAAERERLLNVFWDTGTWHQASFTRTILPMFTEQGLWPESLSYSFMPNVSMVLNAVDRIKPEWNVADSYGHIFDGIFLFDHLRNPDRRFVRYGDSKRNNDSTESLYIYAMNFADRRGNTELLEQAQVALKQAYDAAGGSRPGLDNGTFDNYEQLKLLWGLNLPETVGGAFDFNKPTALVTHAGIALQRNAVDVNNVDYGLTGIIGGAHYVHSHVTGISMELYGAGYVMAPNAGLAATLAERQEPENKSYFRLHAGNNCVIVNGTSHGRQSGSWASNSYLWQDTVLNEASEPLHLEDPVSPNHSFATQYLNDTINQAEQQRTLAIIRTSPTTAFYFDLFRSHSLVTNNFHDYIYHNIGDSTLISSTSGVLGLTPTTRYDNDIGDPVGSPGWRFFEQEQVTPETAEPVKVQFRLNSNNRSMNLFVPDGVAREYTHALAPPTREAKNGYVNKKTQVLAIRQQGEAWDRPFIAVLEPSTTFDTSVQSVTQLTWEGRVVGAKVESLVNGQTITNYIICNEGPNGFYENPALGLSFTGRFGVITDRGDDDVELYIGEGAFLTYGTHFVSSTSGNNTAVWCRFAPAEVYVAPTDMVLTDDAGNWTGSNRTVQNPESRWYDGADLADGGSSVETGDPVNGGSIPGASYGWDSAVKSRIRSSEPMSPLPELTLTLGGAYDLTGLVLWGHGELANSARSISDVTVSFSTDGTTFTGAEVLSFTQPSTSGTTGDMTIPGEMETFSATYAGVTHVRLSGIDTFAGTPASGTHLVNFSEIRFTALGQSGGPRVNARAQVNVAGGGDAALFLDIHGSHAVLSWPGTDLGLWQSHDLTEPDWVRVPNGDVRPVVVPTESDEQLFFRILEK